MWRRSHVPTASRASPALFAALLLTFLCAPSRVIAQGGIHGHVHAADTQLPIAGALVALVGSTRTTQTDARGRFSMPSVTAGTHALLVRRLGYRADTIAGITVRGDTSTQVAVELTPATRSLDSVLVSTAPGIAPRTGSPPRAILSHDDIASAPQIAADAFRALARIPGVSSSDLSAGFRVRGAPNREVLLLFDGMELYEPFHLKDFDGALSIIDPAIIGGATVSTGGFGARYGGHLAGVLELETRHEHAARGSTSLSASLGGLSATRLTPFADGRGEWLVSARRGLLGTALALTGNAQRLSPHYYDAFTRLRYRPSERNEVALSVLRAGDDLRYDAEDSTSLSSAYGSTYAWLTWRTSPSSRVTGRWVVSLARLDWDRDGRNEHDGKPTLSVADKRSFEALGVKQDWTIVLNDRIDIDVGAQLQRLTARYDYTRWQSRPRVEARRWVSESAFNDTDMSPAGTAVGVYFSQRLRPTSALTIEGGARYDQRSVRGERSIDPRASLVYSLGERTSVHAAWGRYSQPQQLYELQVQDGAGRLAPPERAEHRVMGVEYRDHGGFTVGAEAYERRVLRASPRYINLTNSLDIFPEAAGDRTLIMPTGGDARGIELSVASSRDAVQWSINYALSAARDVVDGQIIPRAFDQSHALYADLSVRPLTGWRVSAAWHLHSGWPATPIDFAVDTLSNGTHHVYARYGRLNSSRIAPYHRLDLRVTNERGLGARRLSIYLDIFNVYNRDNPRGLGYTVADWTAARAAVSRSPMTQLPMLPTLGATLTF